MSTSSEEVKLELDIKLEFEIKRGLYIKLETIT